MADLGVLLDYWAEPGDQMRRCSVPRPPPLRLRLPPSGTRAYAAQSSLDVSDIAYYQCFGYWKLACIMQGVFARYSAGLRQETW